MKWTDSQQEVIDTRGKNILVSAAAGSGKTAVLTQRILELVSDREHPMDVDRLVVVTFTKAAAGEMRERILKALQKKAEEYLEARDEEGYWYLQKQLAFVHNAKITTIDSFCMEIVREHFAVLDLDPAFQVGEEGELILLQADVMEELLENFYQEAAADFLEFVDIYSGNKSDHAIEEMILTMYRFAQSYPYPEEWLKGCADTYREADNFEESGFYQAFDRHCTERLETVQQVIKRCIELAGDADGPQAYVDALYEDLYFVQSVLQKKTYEKKQECVASYQAARLKTIRKGSCNEEKKEYVKAERDEYKNFFKELKEKFYVQTREEVCTDFVRVRENVEVLIRLVLAFSERYREAKKEKNLVDFSDLEHFALEILVKRDENGTGPSEIALEMAKDIGEILVDEYQDSNQVQEMILQSLSGKPYGRENLFMVGDVKQSIYKFRMAKPELFLQKYHTYERSGEGPDRKIILAKNFRSRKTILHVINQIFAKIMTEELGGITYDENQSLFYGADYEEGDAPVELMLADISKQEEERDLKDDVDAIEIEAEMIAVKIKKLYEEKFPVRDAQTGKKRPVRFSDMAILLRSMGERAEVIERTLRAHGIPVKCPVKKGCFASFEVDNILQFLAIIDNPRQDIPLVAVLKNIMHLSEEEIAKIKISGQQREMYDNVKAIALADDLPEDLVLWKKVKDFYALLQKYRQQKAWMSIYDLIQEIIEDTGFLYFILAFPDGEMRHANIEMLKEKASIYQESSYSGLFHFIRYIEKNNQYEIEQETINGAGNTDAVTMMSIHKSKGLEYPVVFVSALAKQFNQEDTRRKILLHPEYGVGMDCYNTERGIYHQTLVKRCLASEIKMENLAEELRVLYVALTRAKEKLILTACAAPDEKKWKKYERLAKQGEEQGHFNRNQLLEAKSYLDLLVMSLLEGEAHIGKPQMGYCFFVIRGEEIAEGLVKQEYIKIQQSDVFAHWDAAYVYDAQIRESLKENLTAHYPYEKESRLKAKVSITEIKKLSLEAEEETEKLFESDEKMKIIPKFLGGGTIDGAGRGTAYHRVFELLDYQNLPVNREETDDMLDGMQKKGLLTKEERESISGEDILVFLKTELAGRMKKAAGLEKLWREQQFVMEMPASGIYKDYEGKEKLLIQGMMDAYFEEEGKIYLVDYKTDRVRTKEILINRYREQLRYYAYALERIMGCEVADEIIYSVALGKAFSVRE